MFRITLPRGRQAGQPFSEEAAVIAFGKSNALSRVAFDAEQKIEQAMKSSGLGKLSKAIKSGSSANKSRFQSESRLPSGRLRRARSAPSALQNTASQVTDSDLAWVTVKGRFTNPRQNRSLQAAEAYATGVNIRPRNPGGWLWIPTGNGPRRVSGGAGGGRRKVEPHTWPKTWPPLRFVKTKKGALLIADAQLNSRRGKGKLSRTFKSKAKRPVKSAQPEDVFEVAMFYGIRMTHRSRRYNPRRIARQALREFNTYLNEEIFRGADRINRVEMVTKQ